MMALPARLLRTHARAASTAASTAPGAAGAAATASSDSTRPRVCILGGGFGGLYTAIKLQLLMWPRGKKPQAGWWGGVGVCDSRPGVRLRLSR
jgi:NADH:ubiquinone reductase (non-electrogenic)